MKSKSVYVNGLLRRKGSQPYHDYSEVDGEIIFRFKIKRSDEVTFHHYRDGILHYEEIIDVYDTPPGTPIRIANRYVNNHVDDKLMNLI